MQAYLRLYATRSRDLMGSAEIAGTENDGPIVAKLNSQDGVTFAF